MEWSDIQIRNLIWIINNTDENFRKLGKIYNKSKYRLNSAPKLSLSHAIISSVILDNSFHQICIHKIISFAYSGIFMKLKIEVKS